MSAFWFYSSSWLLKSAKYSVTQSNNVNLLGAWKNSDTEMPLIVGVDPKNLIATITAEAQLSTETL